MNEVMTQTYVGLDVGTSKVRCAVGMLKADDSSTPTLIGYAEVANSGMRKGVVAHIEDVAGAITQALEDAERVSGTAIKSATVNINGAHIQGINSSGVVAISAQSREITTEDRLRVEEAASIMKMASNREIVQVFAREYKIDGQENVKDPVGLQGVRLEVDTHIVTASSPSVRILEVALDKSSLHPRNKVVGSLAAAEAVLSRAQKESGVVVIDVGAGTTNVVVMEDGEVQHVAVIPVGGNNITNDLAIGLKVDLDVAERVKIGYEPAKTGDFRLSYEGESYNFERSFIQLIIESRVKELFELVDKELKKINRSKKLPAGAVIVGGSAKLKGIEQIAKEVLAVSTHVGDLKNSDGVLVSSNGPEAATAVGLMMLDMLLDGDATEQQTSTGIAKIFKNLFNKNKK
jgi:cell division protein FtsA